MLADSELRMFCGNEPFMIRTIYIDPLAGELSVLQGNVS